MKIQAKKALFLSTLLAFSLANALEFGIVGNTPASVGGAGVAYRKNSWALHYNPALLGANRAANIAYSFGVGYGEDNLAQLLEIDLNNLSNLPDTISSITGNGANKANPPVTTAIKSINISPSTMANLRAAANTTTPTTTGTNYGDFGMFSEILQRIHWNGSQKGIGNEDDLKGYIDHLTGTSGDGKTGSATLEEAVKKLTESTDKEKYFLQIQGDLKKAVGEVKQDGKYADTIGIIESIVNEVDPKKIGTFLEEVKNSKDGQFDVSKLLTSLGGITILRGANGTIDRLLDDYKIIDSSMNQNALNVHSNNGFAFHIGGGKNRGAIGFGVLANAYALATLSMSKTYNKFIVKAGDKYYSVNLGGNKITLDGSDATTYENSSILSPKADHLLITRALAIVEAPIAYGDTIGSVGYGEIHLGAAFKYIHAVSMFDDQKINLENAKIDFNPQAKMRQTSTFGIDLGALYTMDEISIGFVAKNLNAPKIRTANGSLSLDRQYRVGMGFEVWKLTFLADFDLVANNTLNPNQKSQMLGGGAILDGGLVNLRLGAMRDMRTNPYGTILTAGLNLFHFIDISVQSSLKFVNVKNVKMPNYLDLRLGGRFLF